MAPGYRAVGTSCANHADAAPAGTCARCRAAFCDPCLVFIINGRAWCELCANNESENGKGNKALAFMVCIGGLAAWAALLAVQLFVIGRLWFYSFPLVLLPVVAAWRIAWPPTAGDPPIIVDRRRTPAALPR